MKERLIYLGAATLLVLIIVNSVKPLPLREVQESDKQNFDNSNLPTTLKPPTRLNEGEPLPSLSLPKKNFLNISFKPRFDT
jgi:hypothetical protein